MAGLVVSIVVPRWISTQLPPRNVISFVVVPFLPGAAAVDKIQFQWRQRVRRHIAAGCDFDLGLVQMNDAVR